MVMNRHGDTIICCHVLSAKTENDMCRRERERKSSYTSVQVLLIEGMDFLCQVRPAQRPGQLLLQFLLIVTRSLARQLDLPRTQVIQQPHIWLNQHRKPSRAHDEICIDKWEVQVFHHIRNLSPLISIPEQIECMRKLTVTVALLETPTLQCTNTCPPPNLAFSIQSQIGSNWGSSVSIPSSQTPLISRTFIRPSRSSIHKEPWPPGPLPATKWAPGLGRLKQAPEEEKCGGGTSAHSPTETTCVIPSA
jgi:hypothetical protein